MCDNHPINPDELAEATARADEELVRLGFNRRDILRSGAALVAAGGLGAAGLAQPAAAAPARRPGKLTWLVGDHHVHTQYSHDAKYKVNQQLDAAQRHGVDWLVFTEHSNTGHRKQGIYDQYEELQRERSRRNMLIFQGIEWYIPSAEHCTVFTTPSCRALETLCAFELVYDGKLNAWEKAPRGSSDEAAWEQKAVEAITWLGEQKKRGLIGDALVFANHPMRLGIDSPHEMRNWRDADPHIMIGMEGAPGAQGYGVGKNVDPGDQRGEHGNKPSDYSWLGYTEDMMRPWGGFDWMTATVGGMWDSMLAEGKPFFITTNSDNHLTVKDTWKFDASKYPQVEPWLSGKSEFDKFNVIGRRPDPVATDEPQGGSDFWPGQFSRNHVGATSRSYSAVMEALRAGRSWVDHGHLLQGFDVQVSARRGRGKGDAWGNIAGLGDRVRVRRGQDVQVTMAVTTTDYANFAGIVPELAHVDIIGGPVTGRVLDREGFRAPQTTVMKSFDTTGRRGTFTLSHVFRDVEESFYIRFRGSDGNRHGAGYFGRSVDPHGPIRHGNEIGDANPIFVDATR